MTRSVSSISVTGSSLVSSARPRLRSCDEGVLQRDTQGFGDDVVPAWRLEAESICKVCSDHGQHTCPTVPLNWLRALLRDDSLSDLFLDDGIELKRRDFGNLGPLVEESHAI